MTEEQLAEIRGLMARMSVLSPSNTSSAMYHRDRVARDLLAEVERLRHALAETESSRDWLKDQNVKLCGVVKVVAEADNSDHSICYQLCELEYWGMHDGDVDVKHIGPCTVEAAEALMKEGAS